MNSLNNEPVDKASMPTSPGKEGDRLASQQQPLYYNASDPVLGTVVTEYDVQPSGCCWYCQSAERADMLFKPCACNSFIHRDCFRKWRTGWINPRNYFQCPNCCHSYKMERVRVSSGQTKANILRNYRFGLIKLWLGTFLFIGGIIAILATIAYFSDRSEKNIPVAIKFMMTSVVGGFPNSNSTAEWRENFRKPDVYVWPYYSLLGLLITSLLILIGFCFLGCTFDEKERRHRNCCADCCAGNNGNDVGLWWCYCYDPCPHCNCNINCVEGCKGCGSCGGGGGDCKCDGDGAQVLIILLVVIIVIIILSAIVVVILYAIQKGSLLYDRMTHALLSQAQELEGETVVLAVNESWRPYAAV